MKTGLFSETGARYSGTFDWTRWRGGSATPGVAWERRFDAFRAGQRFRRRNAAGARPRCVKADCCDQLGSVLAIESRLPVTRLNSRMYTFVFFFLRFVYEARRSSIFFFTFFYRYSFYQPCRVEISLPGSDCASRSRWFAVESFWIFSEFSTWFFCDDAFRLKVWYGKWKAQRFNYFFFHILREVWRANKIGSSDYADPDAFEMSCFDKIKGSALSDKSRKLLISLSFSFATILMMCTIKARLTFLHSFKKPPHCSPIDKENQNKKRHCRRDRL